MKKIELHQVISWSDWQWYSLNEKEKEKESLKEIPTDWESEQTEKVIERNKRIRLWEQIKTPEERKKEKQ